MVEFPVLVSLDARTQSRYKQPNFKESRSLDKVPVRTDLDVTRGQIEKHEILFRFH